MTSNHQNPESGKHRLPTGLFVMLLVAAIFTLPTCVEPAAPDVFEGAFFYQPAVELDFGTGSSIDPPKWSGSTEGFSISYSLSPPEGETLPAGLVIDKTTGRITVPATMLPSQSGKYTVRAEASSQDGSVVETRTFAVQISVRPRGMKQALGVELEFGAGDTLYLPERTDLAEGESVAYSIAHPQMETLPDGLTIDSKTGVITIPKTLLPSQSGQYMVTAEKTAQGGDSTGTIRTTVGITIKPWGRTLATDAELEFAAVGTIEPSAWPSFTDGESAVYSLSPPEGETLPAGLVIDKTTGRITVPATMLPSQSGKYTVRAEVSAKNQDLVGRSTTTVEITIKPQQLPDSFTYYVGAETMKRLSFSGSEESIELSWGPDVKWSGDPSPGALTFKLSPSLPYGFVMAADTGTISYNQTDDTKPKRHLPQEYTVTATTTDGSARSLSASVTVAIAEKATNSSLYYLIVEEMDAQNTNDPNLVVIDASGITNTQNLDADRQLLEGRLSEFNGDVSSWDTSNFVNMSQMFTDFSSFNGDLSGWNVGNVKNMWRMFYVATAFNRDISGWKTGNVENMSDMFLAAKSFNQDISKWDVGKVKTMQGMFAGAYAFNGDISGWDVRSVKNMNQMFFQALKFNQDISGWNVANVTDMREMFKYVKPKDAEEAAANPPVFNQDLSSWNVVNVTNMKEMFKDAAAFNQDLSDWNVVNVTSMTEMFMGADAFNKDLSDWNVKSLRYKTNMFTGSGVTEPPNWSK